jgi:hypothetical protein
MQLDLDMPYVLDVESPAVVLEPTSVTVGRELHSLETVLALEARIAWTLARLRSAEECPERFIQPPKRSLSRREIGSCEARQVRPAALEACRLFAVGDGASFSFVGVSPVSESEVVEPPVGIEHRIQSLCLRTVRVEPVFESLRHSTASGFLLGDVVGYCLIQDVSCGTNVVRPTPQARHAASKVPVTLSKDTRGVSLELMCQPGRREVGRSLHE